jgi:GNAT superfamily N-acetyltransferase
MLANVQAGFESYSSFTPPGWRPPDAEEERGRSLVLLGDPGTFALLGLVDGSAVGHVAFCAARELVSGEPPENPLEAPLIPVLAHFWQLFVLPPWWGQGVASVLHDEAAAEMRRRGYESARLFTPSLQGRARSFYERRGWESGAEHWSEHFQLMMVEYRLELGPRSAAEDR